MDILFLSHCAPNPPDKGERIRAHHELLHFARKWRVHLACFARDAAEERGALDLRESCASVYVERISRRSALVRAGAQFALGDCLNAAFYRSSTMRRYVAGLARSAPISAVFAYSAVMAQYAPAGPPLLLDFVDVDSEKWFEYGRTRRGGLLYRMEARRLRNLEAHLARTAESVWASTENEAETLRAFVPDAPVCWMENGVEFGRFDARPHTLPGLDGRRFVVFVGSMDYFPNIEAASWFTRNVYPELRRRDPSIEFFVVGRNPTSDVQALAGMDGVVVTGATPDVRPYLASARAVVAPLTIARGVQNKVLEALAMGRQVFASEPVCRTFGSKLPAGIVRCASGRDFVQGVASACAAAAHRDRAIRESAQQRFSWETNLERMAAALESVADVARELTPGALA